MNEPKYTMRLERHDEKHFGFWGGLYLMPEPNIDEVQCEDIAAICEHPRAEEFSRLFAAAPEFLETLEELEAEGGFSVLEDVYPEYVEKLCALMAKAKGETP